jgi:hypothetical protein
MSALAKYAIAILHVGGTNVGKDQSRQKLKGRAQEQ